MVYKRVLVNEYDSVLSNNIISKSCSCKCSHVLSVTHGTQILLFGRSAGFFGPLHHKLLYSKIHGHSMTAQLVKNLPAMQETLVWFLGQEDPLEKGQVTHSSVLGLPCGSAGKESACNVGDLGLIPVLGRFPWRRKRLPTPVFWPGKFHGLYGPWDHKELGMTEWLTFMAIHFQSLENQEETITSFFLDWGSWRFLVLLCPSMAHSAEPQPGQTARVATDSKPLFLPPNLPFPLTESHAEVLH